jgi:LacI family transcriptional regulator
MRALLGQRRKPPRAVVAGNDQMAIGAVRALAGIGLAVPQDVAVVGFDDISLTHHVRPPLTTVRQPMRAVGQECARLLQRRFDMPDAEQVASMLPTELVVRQSCGCAEAAR